MPEASGSPLIIRIAAGLLTGAHHRTLLVRKRGTTAFMQPGGKIEGSEPPLQALIRELWEELTLTVAPSSPTYLGKFSAPAAHEAGAIVEAELFRVPIVHEPRIGAEIEEAVWVDPDQAAHLALAPLTRDVVLPLYRAMISSRA